VLKAHHWWRTLAAPERYHKALDELHAAHAGDTDWVVAAREWVQRRADKWAVRMAREHETLGEA
jgi:hypothetical protein